MDCLNKVNDVMIERLSDEVIMLREYVSELITTIECMECEIEDLVVMCDMLRSGIKKRDCRLKEQEDIITKYELLDMIKSNR